MSTGLRWWVRLAVVAAAVVVCLPGAGAAYAEDPVAVLDTWSPRNVSGGWTTSAPDTPVTVTRDLHTCSGRQRDGSDASRRLDMRLTWIRCASAGARAWAAYFERQRRSEPAGWRAMPTAFATGSEVVGGLVAGNQRYWIQGAYVLILNTACPSMTRFDCAEVSRAAASDLADRIGIAPTKLAGNRGRGYFTSILSWVLILEGALGAVALGRLLVGLAWSRFAFPRTDPQAPEWFAVDRDARDLRRRARLRRHGWLLILPAVLYGLVLGTEYLVSTVSTDDVAELVLPLFVGLVGVVLLMSGHDASPSDAPPRGGVRRPAGRVVLWLALTIVTGALLALVLVLDFGDLFIGDQVGTTLLALSFLLALPLWPLSWWLAWLGESDAWRRRNARTGRPALLLGGFGESAGWLWARRPRSGGPSNRITQLAVRAKPQSFRKLLLTLLAGHGPVLTAGAPGRPVKGPAATAALGLADWEPRLRALIRDSRVVVICAGLDRAGSPLRELAVVGAESTSKPIMVVLGPGTTHDVGRRYAQWRAAVRDIAPFSQLPVVPSGTHVLVHLPGTRWTGWGAGRRDEWTYARAVNDALAHVFLNADREVRPGDHVVVPRLPDDADLTGQPAIAVLAGDADRATADQIAASLVGMGLPVCGTAEIGRIPVRAVAVVLSAAAAADPRWRAEFERAKGLRIVGIRIGTTANSALPEELAGLNWVRWSAEDGVRSRADLFVAITSDPQEYVVHRDLVYQARGWVAARRDPALLIGDRREARRAADHLMQTADDPLSRPGPLLNEFVQASLALGRRRQRRSRALGAVVVAAVALLAGAGIYTVAGLLDDRDQNQVATVVAAVPADTHLNPALAGVKAGTGVLRGNAIEKGAARLALLRLLDRQPWPSGVLTASADNPARDVAMVHDGTLLLVAPDTLAFAGAGTGSAEWIRSIAPGGTALDAAPDASAVVVGGDHTVQLIRTAPWQRQAVAVDGPVAAVAVDPASRQAAAVVGGNRLVTIGLDPPYAVRPAGTFDRVLTLRHLAGSGGLRALVTTAGAVKEIDPLGAGGAVAVAAPATTVIGALDPGGTHIAVVQNDRRLFYGSATDLRPTGQVIPDGAAEIAVLPGDRIVVAGLGAAPAVFDVRSGIVTDRLGPTAGAAVRLRTDDDGTAVAAVEATGVTTWSTAGLGSVAGDDSGSASAGPALAAVPGGTLRADGSLSLEDPSGGAHGLQTVRGTVTASAVSADGRELLVGSAGGEVTQVSLTSTTADDNLTALRRWTAPSGAAVERVGWSGTGHLMIRTADGIWWHPESCEGCDTDSGLLGALRAHLMTCYPRSALSDIDPAVLRRLGVRTCAPAPSTEAG
ncbi:hypothetical protein [Dactylosporangium sp. CA-092794]|uniref:hypothetical protein n=1 Tax=Dactylosporangium sp. CA-092794 TaxID=3239929 RepID=UPI003D9132AA